MPIVSATTEFLIGVFALASVISLAAGLYFITLWLHARGEVEYLLAGLLALPTAIYCASNGVAYWRALLGRQVAADIVVAVIAGFATTALYQHFALRYTRSSRERPIALALYAGSAVAAALVSLAAPAMGTVYFKELPSLGLVLPQTPVDPSLATHVALGLVPLNTAVPTYLLFADYKAGNREARFAAWGTVPVVLASVNDAYGAGLGLYPTVAALPFGHLCFLLGAGFTFIDRYGRRSRLLGKRTRRLRRRAARLEATLAELRAAEAELVQAERFLAVGQAAMQFTREIHAPLARVDEAIAAMGAAGSAPGVERLELDQIARDSRVVAGLVTDLLSAAGSRVPAPSVEGRARGGATS